MPVVWGLDLKEIHWSKFKNSYMWNTDYHLRRTKFIVYQLASVPCRFEFLNVLMRRQNDYLRRL